MADPPTLADRLQSPTVRWVVAGLVVVVALMAGLLLSRKPSARQTRGGRSGVPLNIRREPATPEARALLAPVTEGTEVAGWRATLLEGPRDGQVHVVFHKDGEDIEVIIALRRGTTVSSPVVAGPYALFNMGLPHLDRQAMTVMRALAENLRAKTNAPPGLGPFVPGR